jgi:hypothetical protein
VVWEVADKAQKTRAWRGEQENSMHTNTNGPNNVHNWHIWHIAAAPNIIANANIGTTISANSVQNPATVNPKIDATNTTNTA